MERINERLRSAEHPILVKPTIFKQGVGRCRRILVPLDGSPTAEIALTWAKAIARRCGGAIGLIRVVTVEEIIVNRMTGVSRRLEREWIETERYLVCRQVDLEKEGFECWRIVAVGPPAETIVDYARIARIDLLVMTTHGRSESRRRAWGQVCEHVLRAVPVAVLLIPSRIIFEPARVEKEAIRVLKQLETRTFPTHHL
jgi:nucleotide-binding universal stress UspA family protein